MLRWNCKRLWTMGFWWLMTLTGINLFLTSRLIVMPPTSSGSIPSSITQQEFNSSLCSSSSSSSSTTTRKSTEEETNNAFANINLNQSRFDASRKYKILDNVIMGEKHLQLAREYDVTLATQSSLDKLHWLSQGAKSWDGPITVALFVPDIEYDITGKFVHHMRRCEPEVMTRVAISIIFPVDRPPKHIENGDLILNRTYSCNMNIAKVITTLFESPNIRNPSFQQWRTSYPYPQNLARNVARKTAHTHYTFVADIDIVPSKDSAKGMARFLASNKCAKCAFVVATYEMDASAQFPDSKSQLLTLVEQKKARPFHKTVFLQNQYATNVSMYERPQDDSVVHVSHNVTNFEFFYEPFYVALDQSPPYDERFIGYGFTRNTQVYEMWVAEWSFQVLSPVFAIHWGLQKKRGRPGWRERQNNTNRKRFNAFKKEVWARYGKVPPEENNTDKSSETKNKAKKAEPKPVLRIANSHRQSPR